METPTANSETLNQPTRLPRPQDRLRLRETNVAVSPICIGMTESPDTIIAAYEAGINFFFISADWHWPLYEHTRQGLRKLLQGSPSRRDEIVVTGVSYLDEPIFAWLDFHEIVDSVPGLERIDVLVAGAVTHDSSLSRITTLQQARATHNAGAMAIGASFHDRRLMLHAPSQEFLDIHYFRYNPGHPGARRDLFPHMCSDSTHLTFGFNSQRFRVTEDLFGRLDLAPGSWLPSAGDYYRFALTPDRIQGILCSPMTPREVRLLVHALERGPLTPEEQQYMIRLSRAAYGGK